MQNCKSYNNGNNYDKFEIIIKEAELEEQGINKVCDIYINGERFIDMIADDEGKSGYDDSICGAYIGQFPEQVLLPIGTEYIDIESNLTMEEDGRVHTLACNLCGMSECWTVRARITVTDETVTWSEIGHKEGRLGPYTFNKEQYLKALDHGNAAFFSAYCYANGIYTNKDMRIMKERFMDAVKHKNKQAIAALTSFDENKIDKDLDEMILELFQK